MSNVDLVTALLSKQKGYITKEFEAHSKPLCFSAINLVHFVIISFNMWQSLCEHVNVENTGVGTKLFWQYGGHGGAPSTSLEGREFIKILFFYIDNIV